MEIYLIRHTKPLVDNDICYGQTDILPDDTLFEQSALQILQSLPQHINAVYSSPLKRCSMLAAFIKHRKYHSVDIHFSELIMELNFGEWENKKWNDINQDHLTKWMNDYENEVVPGGESFSGLLTRVKQFINAVTELDYSAVAVITHAGVIRAAATYILKTKLGNAFLMPCEYASVHKIEYRKPDVSDSFIK